MSQLKLFSSTRKAGNSAKTGKPYAFFVYLVQIDYANAASAVMKINGDTDLEPGVYEFDPVWYAGEFQKPETKFTNFRPVK